MEERFVSWECRINAIFRAEAHLHRERHRNHPAVLPQDTLGISKVLNDYTVETTFQKLGDSSTKVEISHYYSTPTDERLRGLWPEQHGIYVIDAKSANRETS